ncbi:MAG TPA: 2-oxoglutarate dehydrogenase E1 component [Polyangia bacterium]|nr:2-oxoglutarate dehydrogenase E1 component [Polyangia bacterium]
MIEVKAKGANAGEAEEAAASFRINPANLAFAEEIYAQFLQDPASVDPAWRAYFEALDDGVPRPSATAVRAPSSFARSIFATVAPSSNNNGVATAPVATKPPGRLQSERAQRLVEAYRELGHLSAELDPLGLVKRAGAPLDLEFYGLSSAELDQVFSSETVAGPDRTTLRDLVQLLRETYCRHIGVELAHLHDVELRTWLQNRMESTRNHLDLTHEERWRLLEKVTDAEVFEQFLHKKFLGAKRFSLEGAESLIPLLDRLIERAARSNVSEIVIGMAHRGRLNVLANVMEKPAAQIFGEFMDKHGEDSDSGGGDVKYHLGHSNDRVFGSGADAHRVHLSLSFNPSHLEWVNTVVQGRVRAKQDRLGDSERSRCLPLLIHGDAAFAGQGIVAEALNLSELEGYRVGGTVHIVVNNQIGFTTPPKCSYSTTYATDVARMLQIPIFHVNGEDPEAVSQVVDLALDFRQRFHRDALIEMWCYRKYGHNEGDEPSFTQPIMYRTIADKPSIRVAFVQAFGKRPLADGSPAITVDDAERLAARRREALDRELERANTIEVPPPASTFTGAWAKVRGGSDSAVPQVPTAVPIQTIQAVGRVLTEVPPGFSLHPKLQDIVEARAEMALGEKPVNWGMGEALAFGTLLDEGVRVRFTGQDVRRGTFSHRHAVFIDYETGREYTPLSHIRGKQGVFDIHDSPLSEAGVLGFDYGYSLDMPDGLTLWEAQFGDFLNGAQVIVDQFLVSSEAKWNRVSGLVLLLPHGMEGQGPEHSSARLERFLTLAVNDNIQVCNLTTPAQYFHVLRRQVLRPYRKPLVIMSPKSLLRHPAATSPLSAFTQGRFQHIIPDTTVKAYSKVRRVLLCTGKVYYDLVAERQEKGYGDVAILRVEQLYPLQIDELLEMLSVYPEGTSLVWVQEEPRNMGGWVYMNRELPGFLSGSFNWSCVSRPLSASPAVGSLGRHKREQARLMADAFGVT